MRGDYPELEGNGIEYCWLGTDVQKPGRVIGCNFDVGITVLHEIEDAKLLCLNGPSHEDFDGDIDEYTKQFYMIVGMLMTGRYQAGVVFENWDSGAVSTNCSYSGY